MSTHGSAGDLCTDDCRHLCPACQRGETCVDLFEDPIAGVIACTNEETQP